MTIVETIRPYVEQGMMPQAIAEITGLPLNKTQNAVKRMVFDGLVPPRRPQNDPRKKNIADAMSKRGISEKALWWRIRNAISRDNLFDAILDDRGAK